MSWQRTPASRSCPYRREEGCDVVRIACVLVGVGLTACVSCSAHTSEVSIAPPVPTTAVHATTTTTAPIVTTTTLDMRTISAELSWKRAVWANAVHRLVMAAQARRLEASVTSSPSPTTGPTPNVEIASPCNAYVFSLLARYFDDVLAWAVRVARRESKCNADVIDYRENCSPSGDHAEGVMQLCWPMHAGLLAEAGCSSPLDAECNIRMARLLYDADGRAPWGGSRERRVAPHPPRGRSCQSSVGLWCDPDLATTYRGRAASRRSRRCTSVCR
jgi:hypothetical protein